MAGKFQGEDLPWTLVVACDLRQKTAFGARHCRPLRPVLIQYSLENCRPRDIRGAYILEAHDAVALIEFSGLEPLTDMGHTVEETYGRLCSEAFYDGVLNKKLTGIKE